MSKKSRKDSFFKKSVNAANKGFKSIFKDIIQNAKENSGDVDLRIVEPNLKEIVKEVSEELKKDRENNKAKLSEIKGIVTNSFSALKEAIKGDTKNGLDDKTKDEWVRELDDFDIDSFLEDFDLDEDDEDLFSNESEDSNDMDVDVNHILSVEDAQRVFDAITVLLCGAKGSFKDFLQENSDQVSSILSYKTVNEVETPVTIKPNEANEIDIKLTKSMELVKDHIGLEEDDIVDEEPEEVEFDEDLLETDEVDTSEPLVSEMGLLTSEAIDELVKFRDETEEEYQNVLNLRSHLSENEKLLLDYGISLLIEVYELYKKFNPEIPDNVYDFINEYIEFFKDDENEIVDEYFKDGNLKLVIILSLIMNFQYF